MIFPRRIFESRMEKPILSKFILKIETLFYFILILSYFFIFWNEFLFSGFNLKLNEIFLYKPYTFFIIVIRIILLFCCDELPMKIGFINRYSG